MTIASRTAYASGLNLLFGLRQQIGEQNIKYRGDEQAAANAETRNNQKTHGNRAKRRTEKICRRKISQRVSHTNSITPCGPQRRQNHSRCDSGRAYSRSGQGCDPQEIFQ